MHDNFHTRIILKTNEVRLHKLQPVRKLKLYALTKAPYEQNPFRNIIIDVEDSCAQNDS